MRLKSIQSGFFIILLIVVTLVFFALVQSFLQPVFWAAVLAVIFYPVQNRWLRITRQRRSLASLLTTLTIFFIVILPLIFVGIAVSNEAINLYQRIQSGEIDLQGLLQRITNMLPIAQDTLNEFGIDLNQLKEQLSGAALSTSQFLASQAVSVGQNALRFAALFFLTLYFLFFFLRDGPNWMKHIIRALPLGDNREQTLVDKFATVSRATIKGTLVVGVVQGGLGGLAFWILGIGAPVFWAVIMTLLSLLPAIGTALIWLPAAIILIVTGEVVKGIILIIVGGLLIGMVDNVLRPILVGRDTKMPDVLVLLATLGGLALFGISGFVIGPIIAALFLAVWQMFEEEYGQIDDPPDPDGLAPPDASLPRPAVKATWSSL